MKPLVSNDRLSTWFDRLALSLLMAAFFFAPLNTLRLKGVAVSDFFVILMICLVPISILLYGLPGRAIPKWVLISGGLFAASLILTLIFPFDYSRELYARLTQVGDPYSSSVVIWVRLVFAILVFPLVAGLLVRDWAKLKWIAGAWVIGVAVSCLVAVIDAGLGTHIQESLSYDAFVVRGYMGIWDGVTDYQRFVGLTDHPNTLGITAAMAIPVTIAWFNSRRNMVAVAPVLLLLVAGVFLSGSRAALVGMMTALLALAVMYRTPIISRLRTFFGGPDGKLRIGIAAAIVLVSVASVGFIAVSRGSVGPVADSLTLERIFDPNSATAKSSNDERTASLDAGLDAIAANPVVGSGFIWIETPHNIVLAMLMSGGILALAAFIWAVVGYLRLGFTLRREVPDPVKALISGSFASLIAYFVMSPLVNQSFNRYLYLPAAILFAAWMLIVRPPAAEREPEANAARTGQEPDGDAVPVSPGTGGKT